MTDGKHGGDFLGVGARFPFQVDERGWIAFSRYEEDIEEAIRLIVLTNHGERIMRPDFGANLGSRVFTNMSETSLGAIQSEVMTALVNWEPRIQVLKVELAPDEDQPARLRIDIDYRVRATNSLFNMVVPYVLPGGETP